MLIQLKPHTKRVHDLARRSFEAATGKAVEKATQQDIEHWLHTLRIRGLKTNTCRTYLSYVRVQAGVNTELPQKVECKRELRNDEITHMLSASSPKNYAWLASMFLAGPEIMNWEWGWLYDAKHITPICVYLIMVEDAKRRGYETFPFHYFGRMAHWVNGYRHEERVWDICDHEINRRLKSIAKAAGIGTENMNITAIKYAHRRLIVQYQTADKAAKALGIKPERESAKPARKADPRLHGIGRRSLSIEPA